ncbi:hypothetical protein NL676_034987 [Syzygium grande]|nr:hypothetical protein NL676_034987 [Syzygium grande]
MYTLPRFSKPTHAGPRRSASPASFAGLDATKSIAGSPRAVTGDGRYAFAEVAAWTVVECRRRRPVSVLAWGAAVNRVKRVGSGARVFAGRALGFSLVGSSSQVASRVGFYLLCGL